MPDSIQDTPPDSLAPGAFFVFYSVAAYTPQRVRIFDFYMQWVVCADADVLTDVAVQQKIGCQVPRFQINSIQQSFKHPLTILGAGCDKGVNGRRRVGMSISGKSSDGTITLAEMREFASFSASTQRYIRRSLDVAFHRADAMELWCRDVVEAASIRAQSRIYQRVHELRAMVPDDSGLDQVEPFIAPLIGMSAFDLGQDRLASFSAYRFLYERLLGAGARPWLPGAFCAAASLPNLHPEKRRALLQSISEAAATAIGWSNREPSFYPEWVEKVDVSKAPN